MRPRPAERRCRRRHGRRAERPRALHVHRRRPDDRAVGYVQATVTDDGRRAEIAWVVGAAFQGHGYATAAALALVAWLDERGVTTVTAHVHPDHRASMAVARRAGLRPVGRDEDGEQVWIRPHVG